MIGKFPKKVMNMTRDDLENLVYKMENHLLCMIDDDAKVDNSGKILVASKQPDRNIQDVMNLLEYHND